MKAIINGKRFNTEKATLIGETSNNSTTSRTDFSYWEAGLYVTPRSGAYFLAGMGGPMTRWAKRFSDGWGAGEGIFPLTAAEALAWAESELSFDVVEAKFSHMIEEA